MLVFFGLSFLLHHLGRDSGAFPALSIPPSCIVLNARQLSHDRFLPLLSTLRVVHQLIVKTRHASCKTCPVIWQKDIHLFLNNALDGVNGDVTLTLHFSVCMSTLCSGLHSLLPCLLEQLLEGRTSNCIVYNAFLIDDTLGPVDIALIAVEAIDASLKRLLYHELLHDQVTSTPVFAQVSEELIAAEIDASCGVSPGFLDDFQDVLGWYDPLWLRLVPAALLVHGFWRWLHLMHVLVDEVLQMEDGDSSLLDDKLLSAGVRVNESILGVLQLGVSDEGSGRHKKLHTVLHTDVADLVNRAVPRRNCLRRIGVHLGY